MNCENCHAPEIFAYLDEPGDPSVGYAPSQMAVCRVCFDEIKGPPKAPPPVVLAPCASTVADIARAFEEVQCPF